MNKNQLDFTKFIEAQGLYIERFDCDESVIFCFPHYLPSGARAKVICRFDNSKIVDIITYNYLKLYNSVRNEKVLEQINKLNSEKYRCITFILDSERKIEIKACVDTSNGFNPKKLFGMMIYMSNVMENEFTTFME